METMYGLNIYLFLIAGIVLTVFAFSVYKLTRKGARESAKSGVKDFTGKFERRDYRFHNGLECCQEQLTLEQNEEFSLLLDELDLGDMAGFTLEKMNKALYLNQGMRKLFAIALMNKQGGKLSEAERLLFAGLKEAEVEEVIEDFFILNPRKKAQFDLLRAAADSLMLMEVRRQDGDSMTAQPAQ